MNDLTEFQKGAVFAMELLKKHVEKQTDALRRTPVEHDISHVLNGVENVLTGLKVRYETDLMKQLMQKK